MGAAKCSLKMLVGGSNIKLIGTKKLAAPFNSADRIGTAILRHWNQHWQSPFCDHLVVPKWSKNRVVKFCRKSFYRKRWVQETDMAWFRKSAVFATFQNPTGLATLTWYFLLVKTPKEFPWELFHIGATARFAKSAVFVTSQNSTGLAPLTWYFLPVKTLKTFPWESLSIGATAGFLKSAVFATSQNSTGLAPLTWYFGPVKTPKAFFLGIV